MNYDPYNDLEASATYQQWHDRSRRDLWRGATILALIAIIYWTATSIPVDGAALPAHTAVDTTHTDIWLTEGSTGEQVTAVQATLAGYGYTIAIDGIFGPQTKSVVRSWQQSNGLHIDGIIGPQTWASLSVAVRGPSYAVGPPPIPPAPVDGNCDSWAPLLERYGIPYDATAKAIMWRESRCSNAVNINPQTRDQSYGPFQVNRQGITAWWNEGGYTLEVMSMPAGAVAAAGVLYGDCGWGPWVKPYSCHGSYQQTARPRWTG